MTTWGYRQGLAKQEVNRQLNIVSDFQSGVQGIL